MRHEKNLAGDTELRSLLRRYQQGDPTAFELLHLRLSPLVRKFFRRKRVAADRLDDLVQETFLQLHRSRHTYDPVRPAEPWVRGLARHVYLMDVRAAVARRRFESPDDGRSTEPRVPSWGESTVRRDLLAGLFERLPEDRRRPVLMRHVWGFTFKEIAETLGIREGAAKVRSHRGIRELRALLSRPAEVSR